MQYKFCDISLLKVNFRLYCIWYFEYSNLIDTLERGNMKITVIDFETANSKRSSACALGIVVIENGKVIEENAWLIKPRDMYFEGMNIAIHGIRPKDVIDKPEFDELYNDIFKGYLDNQLVIAHNASFDMSVLRACLNEYNISFPNVEYLCTVKLSQKLWPELINHKLNTVSDYLRFDFKHHDAFDDARACANIVLEGCKKMNFDDPYELAKKLKVSLGLIYPNGYKPCSCKK